MTDTAPLVLAIACFFLVVVIAFASLKVTPAGSAIIRQGLGGVKISTGAIIVMPVLHKMRVIDLTLSRLALAFRGPENPLITKDKQLFDLKISVFYRLPVDAQAIEDAVKHFGPDTLNDEAALIKFLYDDAENSIRAAAGDFTWAQIKHEPELIKINLLERLPQLTPGLNVEEIAFDHIDTYPPEISPNQGANQP